MESFIKVPYHLEARLLLWADISYHDMELIDQMQSVPDLERVLCSLLCAGLLKPKKEVLLELYVQTVYFCREHNLNKEQTSTLLSIIKSIHEANTETLFNNFRECLKYCHDLLLCHSIRRPPFSINLFSFEEANCVLKYIQDHYMRDYKLYKYIFTPKVTLDLSLIYSGTTDMESSSIKDSSVPDNRFSPSPGLKLEVHGPAALERSGSRCSKGSDNRTSSTAELIVPNPSTKKKKKKTKI